MSDATGFLHCKPESETEPWRRVLRDAADRIERGGWAQGNSVTNPSPAIGLYCPYTAMMGCNSIEACGRLLDYLGLPHDGDPRSVVWRWNDTPGRTAAEVCAALRAAADDGRGVRG